MRQLLRPEDRYDAAALRPRVSGESDLGDLRLHAVAVPQRIQPVGQRGWVRGDRRIVDAYASPTLLADAQKYASINDPSHPLAASQFSLVQANRFELSALCGASGWYGEQTLDVEAVHATAPGAHILFGGAESCVQGDLNGMVRNIVDHHLANVITNSYGDPAGDLLDSESVRAATDNTLLMAAGTGISVLFSSGDWEDNYPLVGTVAPTYPASSPWATGVGGTTLKINQLGQRFGELGWSTARSFLCNSAYVHAGGRTDDQLWTRIIDYEGPEAFCNSDNRCVTRDFGLHTAPGYDNMTGLGSPGDQFLSALAAGH